MESERPISVIPKACANCRIRKIKCSRQFPCSSCEASGIQCQVSLAKTQIRSPAARRPLASESKDEIKQLSQNVEEIRQSVQHLLTLSERRGSTTSPRSFTKTEPDQSMSSDSPHSVFEGVSSFANQAIDAGEASQIFARDQAQLAAAQDGLKSLRDIVNSSAFTKTSSPPKSKTRKSTKAAADMELPPAEFVVQLLQTFKLQPSMSLLAYSFGDISTLEKLCRATYFPAEPVSLGQLATMHGLIIILLKEWMIHPTVPIPEQFDIEAIFDLCERNFDSAIKTYEVIANPTFDNAKALRIAATMAQDVVDMNTCWLNTCCAARHALSLGLHRKSSLVNLSEEEAHDRLHLFWAIYCHDRSVSLTLGQTPTIQDHDVDADLFPISADRELAPWDMACQAYIQFARVEGMIYDRLYTASALRKTNEERLAIAEGLSQTLDEWWQHQNPRLPTECYCRDFFNIVYIVPSRVVWYAMLCTIHRGTYATSASPGTITPACYSAACLSIESHLGAIAKTREFNNGRLMSIYLSWNLLYGTFTPIIVVFLHVISSFDGRDLELLLQFHQSLQDLPDVSVTQGVIRFRSACAIFCSVAKAYVGSRDIMPSTAPVHTEAVVRREDIQQAFDPSQMSGYIDPGDQSYGLQQFDSANLAGMYELVDGWIDGNQQSIDFLNMDLGTL